MITARQTARFLRTLVTQRHGGLAQLVTIVRVAEGYAVELTDLVDSRGAHPSVALYDLTGEQNLPRDTPYELAGDPPADVITLVARSWTSDQQNMTLLFAA